MTRPDGAGDRLGLTVLDEPSTKQSDPHVLDLQLRTHAKQSLEKPAVRLPPPPFLNYFNFLSIACA